MLDNFSGATRVHLIVGDPIAQVKSPFGVTQAFESAGRDAICVPAHVPTQDLAAWFAGISLARNVDGVIVTVPHKFDCHAFCKTSSPRASFLGAVNTIRRNADGSWHGDMFDGLGYIQAMEKKGCQIQGKKALLVGALGAASVHIWSNTKLGPALALYRSLGFAEVPMGDGEVFERANIRLLALRPGSGGDGGPAAAAAGGAASAP